MLCLHRYSLCFDKDEFTSFSSDTVIVGAVETLWNEIIEQTPGQAELAPFFIKIMRTTVYLYKT